MTYNINLYLIFFILFYNCSKKSIEISEKDAAIINNCIEYIIENNEIGLKESYLVNPYFEYYLISNFFESKDKEFIQLFNSKEMESLIKNENSTNDRYFNKFSNELSDFSVGDKSDYIISFSGISADFVIGYLNMNDEAITMSQLKNKYPIVENQTDYFIFELSNNGEIKNVLISGFNVW